ncbi:transposase [Streptomyces asiaticus]|uniref:transposase n=1 Tax=Streptomyces asiaticus TaxID=114695 RepID=UPI0033C6C56C
MDRGRPVASAAPDGAGRTRGPRRGGLEEGSKLHVLSDAQGIPLATAVSGANMHDSLALKPLIRGIPAVRSRRGPRRRRPVKLRADKAHLPAEHLAWLRERGLVAHIARPGIEADERLGRRRWLSHGLVTHDQFRIRGISSRGRGRDRAACPCRPSTPR